MATEKPFSQVIREGSSSDHDSSEGADFMASIMRGTGSREDYADLAAQHYYVYEAMEPIIAKVADDPQFAPFHDEGLARLDVLRSDLEHLYGEGWSEAIRPVPASERYAARILEIGEEGWIPGLIAHHYTRYLGDLSGGQMIARRMVKQHGFDGAGVEFYNFESLGSISEFKERYRAALDVLGARLSDDEKNRMLTEVRAAYKFNTDVFVDLAQAKLAPHAS